MTPADKAKAWEWVADVAVRASRDLLLASASDIERFDYVRGTIVPAIRKRGQNIERRESRKKAKP